MVKHDPEKLIKELNLTKEEVFKYLETNTIKSFKEKYNLTTNKFYCIVNYWGGYKTPKDKHTLICRENGKQSIATPEKLEKAKKDGSRGYETLEQVLSRLDEEEFIRDFYTPMSKKQLKEKYKFTYKMLGKVLNYYNLSYSYENFCTVVKNSFTPELKEKIYNSYKKTMNKLYGVDNYYQSKEFKEYIINKNQTEYGVDWYCQSDDFRSKFKPHNSYYCDGNYFDSSWELKYWIYARDHNYLIKREPIQLNYYFDGVLHTYFPDFLCNNELIEIKGSHMLDENKKLKAVYKTNNQELLDAKQKCIEDNNVKILSESDLQEVFKYFDETGYDIKEFKVIND